MRKSIFYQKVQVSLLVQGLSNPWTDKAVAELFASIKKVPGPVAVTQHFLLVVQRTGFVQTKKKETRRGSPVANKPFLC